MNLEHAIHERWAAASELAALLPAEKVATGCAASDSPPYAVLERRSARPLFHTNAGDALEDVELAIHVWHDDYDAGQAVAAQVQAAFDRTAFDLPGGRRVIQMRRAGSRVVQHAGGLWQFTLEFLVQVYLPSGA